MRKFLFSILLSLAFFNANAQPTTLVAGDIAVLGLNFDDAFPNQRWAFVPLVKLTQGTVIHFTDAGIVNGDVFYSSPSNEGHMTWTVDSDIAAGTVMVVTNGLTTATIAKLNATAHAGVVGSLGGTDFGFAETGDQVIVYQGAVGATAGATFIYALNTAQSLTQYPTLGTWQATSLTNIGNHISRLPAGLTNGTSAIALTSNITNGSVSNSNGNFGFDNMRYNGTVTGTKATLLAAIGNPINWVGDDITPYNFATTLSNFTLSTPPVITGNPANQTINVGASTSFLMTATGAGLTYRWQVSTDGGSNFNPISNGGVYSGTITNTLTITGATASLNGYQYRCVVTNTDGSVNTNAATLTVNTPPSFITHPLLSTICAGANTTFSVTASNATSYQWQVDTGSGFNNVPVSAPYSGATSATLTITGATAVMNGYLYRCVATGTSATNSNIAALTVNSAPSITGQPADRTITVGANTTFSATTSNAAVYQWQVDKGLGFGNVPDSAPYSGTTSLTLTITGATAGLNGYAYRLVAIGIGACVPVAISNSATLILPVISTSGALSALSTTYGTASLASSFNVAAVNLTAGVTLTAPSGYELSVSSGTGYANPLIVGTAGNLVANIYVRLKADAKAVSSPYAGNITLSSPGATDVTVATVSSTVAAKPLTVALNATPLITKTYDGLTSATLVAANYGLNGIEGSDAVTVTGTANYDTKGIGTAKTITANTFVLAGVDAGNYTLSNTSATTTGNITSKSLTVALNATPLITKTYNALTSVTLVPANYNLNGILGSDVVTVSGTANYDTKDFGIGKTITANTFVLAGTDAGNYTLSNISATTTGNIVLKPLTVALNATPLITKTYDGLTSATLVAANYGLNGIEGSDAVTVIGTANYDTKGIGTAKTITANTFVLAGVDAGNYTLSNTSATTTGNITSKSLTVALNATPLITKTYNALTSVTLVPANYNLNGILGSDVVTVSGTANYDTKDFGTAKTITANTFVLAGTDASNYTLSNISATTTGNITSKSLTVALNATPLITKTYDGLTSATLVAANYGLNGIEGSDAVTVSGTANYDTRDIGTAKTITANTFVLAGADAGNYTLSNTSATTTGNITSKSLTVALNATPLITKTYDALTGAILVAANYGLNGILGSDAVTVTGTASYDTKDFGIGKTVMANTFVLAGTDAGNYTLSNTSATTTGNITKRDVNVIALADNKAYGSTDPVLSYSFSPALIAGDSFSGSLIRVAGEDIGNYAIGIGTLAINANYNIIFTPADLSITKSVVTVKADLKHKTYGDTDPALSYTIIPALKSGDEFTGTLARTAGENVGSYTITQGTLALNGNYEMRFENSELAITPKPLLIKADHQSRRVGAANPPLTFTYSGFKAGETSTVLTKQPEISTTATTASVAGSYDITVSAAAALNYAISYQKGILTISDVNTAPTLDAIANQSVCVTVGEQQVILGGISPGKETSQMVTLNVSSSNAALFASLSVSKGAGNNGMLSYKPVAGVTGTATITVTVKDNGGTEAGGVDSYSRSFTITVNPIPVVTITSDKGLSVAKGETIVLTATGGTTYLWSNASGVVSGRNTAVLMVRPIVNTTYTVTASSASGCTSTQSITIQVTDEAVAVKPTNIMSPNGDGVNDKWVIENLDLYPNNEVRVVDRGGRLVYSKKGYDNSWDATLRGLPLAEGTYYYIIDYGDGKTPAKKGFITILNKN